MKIITFIILLTACAVVTFGQITTTKITPKTDQIDATPYDSTLNDLRKDVYKYQGQELYLNKRSDEDYHDKSYDNFILDYKISSYSNKSNIYKCNDDYSSKYDELAGKYFKVLEIIKESEDKYNSIFFLKLQEKKSNDIVYYKYDIHRGLIDDFPFIVVGYFEKQKRLFVGKEFVFKDSEFEGAADIQTGKTVTIRTGQKWKCTDLTIDDVNYKLTLIFENSLGEKTAEKFDRVNIEYWNIYTGYEEHTVTDVFYTAIKADNYKKKFGVENFNAILRGKIKIGMTKEMCKLSWGEPKNINKNITSGKKSEQWYYSRNDLYFENGLLTSILKTD